jgi:hypothetical protein
MPGGGFEALVGALSTRRVLLPAAILVFASSNILLRS